MSKHELVIWLLVVMSVYDLIKIINVLLFFRQIHLLVACSQYLVGIKQSFATQISGLGPLYTYGFVQTKNQPVTENVTVPLKSTQTEGKQKCRKPAVVALKPTFSTILNHPCQSSIPSCVPKLSCTFFNYHLCLLDTLKNQLKMQKVGET